MPASLKVMNVLSDGEIRDVLWSKLAMIPGPVQVSLMRMMAMASDNFEDVTFRVIPSYTLNCLCACGSFIHLNVKPHPASIELLGDLQ